MDATVAIEKLKRQLEVIPTLEAKEQGSEEFKKWNRDTSVLLEKIWGNDSKYVQEFNSINYTSIGATAFGTGTNPYLRTFQKGLSSARAILESMIDEIQEYGLEQTNSAKNTDVFQQINLICDRFHLIAGQLRQRHANQPTLEIKDEYDVQYLFHALLKLYFDDVRAEDPVPIYAGGSSRIDFLLKSEQIAIEIKMTRKTLADKEAGVQLIIDKEKYRAHPDCKHLVCFVYDPDRKITNPRGIENDLREDNGSMPVSVLIRP